MSGTPESSFTIYRKGRRVGAVIAVAGWRYAAWSMVGKIGVFDTSGEASRAVTTEAIRLSRRAVRS